MISAAQIRRSLALLRWGSTTLSDASGVHIGMVLQAQLDDGGKGVTASGLAAIKAALEAEGIEFTSDGGARLRDGHGRRPAS